MILYALCFVFGCASKSRKPRPGGSQAAALEALARLDDEIDREIDEQYGAAPKPTPMPKSVPKPAPRPAVKPAPKVVRNQQRNPLPAPTVVPMQDNEPSGFDDPGAPSGMPSGGGSQAQSFSALDDSRMPQAQDVAPVAPDSALPETAPQETFDSAVGGRSLCFDFSFFSQRRVRLNQPVTVCMGDPDRQLFLRSTQGRTAILNVSAHSLIDPISGITYVTPGKLLCFDHNLPPNARRPWLRGAVVVNCCSDVYFQRNQSGNESNFIFGKLEGPPPNCGQD